MLSLVRFRVPVNQSDLDFRGKVAQDYLVATVTTPNIDRYLRASETEPLLASPSITQEAIAESVNLRRGVLWGLFLSASLWAGIFELVSLLKH